MTKFLRNNVSADTKKFVSSLKIKLGAHRFVSRIMLKKICWCPVQKQNEICWEFSSRSNQIQEGEIGGVYSTHGGVEKYVQEFGCKTCREETTWVTWHMRGTILKLISKKFGLRVLTGFV
jgi:hypothetical protein